MTDLEKRIKQALFNIKFFEDDLLVVQAELDGEKKLLQELMVELVRQCKGE